MEKAAEKVAVVTGGSGTVGSGIIRALLAAGATVVAPLRSEAGEESLEVDVAGVSNDKLDVIILDVGTEEGAAKLAEYVKTKYGHVDYAVSSIGAWWEGGPLLAQTLREVEKQVHNLALSHFLFAKAVVPLIRYSSESSYAIITGGAGGHVMSVDSSLVTVGAACLFGISLALRAELKDHNYRVNEVRLMSRVARHVDTDRAAQTFGEAFSHRVFGSKVVSVLMDTSVKGRVVVVGSAELKAVQGA